MFKIPISIQIGETEYKIRNNGDYRTILDCFAALNDEELTKEERLFASLIIFYEDLESPNDITKIFGDNLPDAITAMYNFFSCGVNSQTTSPHKLIDWERDEQMICAAVNKVAGKEIRLEEYLHWYTFMGYYTAVGEGLLSTVISIRDKIIKGKKLEKQEREFRRDNPQYFAWNSKSADQREADELVKQIWNKEV